jgi:hypothetical protein
MAYPLPQGTLSATEAIDRLVRFKDYRWTKQEAWRAICEGIRKGTLPAYVLYGGRSYDADRAQFASLRDLDPMFDLNFRQFASTTLESVDASYFPRNAIIPGFSSLKLQPAFDMPRTSHVNGLLFFLESDIDAAWCDIDAAWWESMVPKTKPEAFAKWLRGKYGAHRPVLTVDEILGVIKDEGVAPVNIGKRTLEAAIALAWK